MLLILSQVQDERSLERLLENDFERIYDYLGGQQYSVLHGQISEFRLIVSRYNRFYKKLNNDTLTLSFIELLLEVCERYGLNGQFGLLYNLLESRNYTLGSRMNAAALFLLDVRTIEDYQSRLGKIIELLEYADQNEEDDSDKPAITLINYYSKVVKLYWEFNSSGIEEIRNSLRGYVSSSAPYSFLRNHLLTEALNCSTSSYDVFESQVQTLLDEHFAYKVLPHYTTVVAKEFLIEKDSEYSSYLENSETNFNAIRALSFSLSDENGNDFFHSLKRGVAILENEQQLFRYMVAYSAMHKEKLDAAYEEVSAGKLANCEHVVDWGCGQAMGAMVFCDYLRRDNLDHSQGFTLIEPSIPAISRGALHVKKYSPEAEIHTITREFDHLKDDDLQHGQSYNRTLHIFSNILDVELFSLHQLTTLLEHSFTGHQIFVCVSPYITETRKSRIDTFVNHFRDFSGFEEIASVDLRKGEWKNDWTKVMRIFSVDL